MAQLVVREPDMGELLDRACGLIAGGWRETEHRHTRRRKWRGEAFVPRVGEARTWRNPATSTSSVRAEHMELSLASAPQSH